MVFEDENITVLKAEGTGALKNSSPEISTHFSISDSQVAKIEIVCNKTDVDKIVAIISENGLTGNPGDGIIYVSDVNQIFRVKNGLKNGD